MEGYFVLFSYFRSLIWPHHLLLHLMYGFFPSLLSILISFFFFLRS